MNFFITYSKYFDLSKGFIIQIYSRSNRILSISLFTVLILLSLFNINSVGAQSNSVSLTIQSRFDLLESTEISDAKPCNDSISLPLPSLFWNVTEVELNFTNVKQEREIKVIEHNATNFDTLRAAVPGLGVQIDVSEPTTIFGVDIFGAVTSDVDTASIYVQITGYDSGEDEPDSPVYGSTSLNISRTLGWHRQAFDNGISLSPGQYYLVLNGIGFSDFDNLNLYWFFNDATPTFPGLYVAYYYWGLFGGWTWRSASQNKPFLYKIIQRVNRTYSPEKINMTAEIGGNFYPIISGTDLGTGHLKTSAFNLFPNQENLQFSISNNESVKLFFNLSYRIGIRKEFSSVALASIKEGLKVNWSLNPDISRLYKNYSVQFNYPISWTNLNVFRGGLNVTSQILVDTINHHIQIPNSTIVNGAIWLITAQSPNLGLTLEAPLTEYGPNEILYFYINPPFMLGNYSIFLVDSKEILVEEYKIEKTEVSSSRIEFTHTLPPDPNEGTYKAYIYWNNATMAGVTTQAFSVTTPFVLDPILVFLIAVIIVVVGISSFTAYKTIKRSKRIHEEHRQSIFNKYMDILNLDYLIIVEKISGVNIYDQVLAGKNMNATLISGFLQAIQSFGIDLTGSENQSQMVKLEYQNSKILMSEFKDFRLTLIMKENPSQDFLQSIELLSYDINERFGDLLKEFDGEISQFEGIKELVEKRLPISLIYPLKLEENVETKLKLEEKNIINRAHSVMKAKNANYFFVSNLMSQEKGFQAKEAELILKLIEKNIFQPIQ
ncbi:MAG: hypothetical protein ACXABG_00055 [Promethearchaeota archaeon]